MRRNVTASLQCRANKLNTLHRWERIIRGFVFSVETAFFQRMSRNTLFGSSSIYSSHQSGRRASTPDYDRIPIQNLMCRTIQSPFTSLLFHAELRFLLCAETLLSESVPRPKPSPALRRVRSLGMLRFGSRLILPTPNVPLYYPWQMLLENTRRSDACRDERYSSSTHILATAPPMISDLQSSQRAASVR